jgi:hypothetical protein
VASSSGGRGQRHGGSTAHDGMAREASRTRWRVAHGGAWGGGTTGEAAVAQSEPRKGMTPGWASWAKVGLVTWAGSVGSRGKRRQATREWDENEE